MHALSAIYLLMRDIQLQLHLLLIAFNAYIKVTNSLMPSFISLLFISFNKLGLYQSIDRQIVLYCALLLCISVVRLSGQNEYSPMTNFSTILGWSFDQLINTIHFCLLVNGEEKNVIMIPLGSVQDNRREWTSSPCSKYAEILSMNPLHLWNLNHLVLYLFIITSKQLFAWTQEILAVWRLLDIFLRLCALNIERWFSWLIHSKWNSSFILYHWVLDYQKLMTVTSSRSLDFHMFHTNLESLIFACNHHEFTPFEYQTTQTYSVASLDHYMKMRKLRQSKKVNL